MKQWSVEITMGGSLDEDSAGDLIDALSAHGPAIAVGKDTIDVKLDVEADTPEEAFRSALSAVCAVAQDVDVLSVSVETVDALERRLAESNVPELLGVAELAAALNVTKQRVSELVRSTTFPAPLAMLKAGPIWQRAAVARFIGTWDRRPGRPRTSATPTAPKPTKQPATTG